MLTFCGHFFPSPKNTPESEPPDTNLRKTVNLQMPLLKTQVSDLNLQMPLKLEFSKVASGGSPFFSNWHPSGGSVSEKNDRKKLAIRKKIYKMTYRYRVK